MTTRDALLQNTGELLRHVEELAVAGELAQAAELLRAASERQPGDATLLVALGDVLVQLGRLIPARRYYQRAIERDAAHPAARLQLARLLAAQGSAVEAIGHYREALKWRADAGPLYTELALLLAKAGRDQEAIELLSHRLEREPQSIEVLLDLGDALMPVGRYAEAESCFRRALAIKPAELAVLNRLGASLGGQDRLEEARRTFEQALQLAPRSAEAATNLAQALWHQGERAASIASLLQFLRESPGTYRLHYYLAGRLDLMGRFDAARRHYGLALALDPAAEDAATDLALLAMVDGDLQPGWYGVWRASLRNRNAAGAADDAALSPPPLPARLDGASIVLSADQGIGDELFFLRYLKSLKERGAQVIYSASPKVYQLLRHRAVGIDQLLTEKVPLPACDHRVVITALPLALAAVQTSPLSPRAEQSSGADPRPCLPTLRRVYWPDLPEPLRLEPNPARLQFWREQLAELGAPPYVAITWRAGTRLNSERLRRGVTLLSKDAPFEALGNLLRSVPGTLISMQRQPKPEETMALSTMASRKVHDCSRANDDLEDTLALLGLVDEYVGVSNTNMHLRAAAGRTARVLVPWPPYWVWQALGQESPWFRGFKVYRQRPDGDWSVALAALSADLHAVTGV